MGDRWANEVPEEGGGGFIVHVPIPPLIIQLQEVQEVEESLDLQEEEADRSGVVHSMLQVEAPPAVDCRVCVLSGGLSGAQFSFCGSHQSAPVEMSERRLTLPSRQVRSRMIPSQTVSI